MFFKRITDAANPMYGEALKLYKISFPYHEQREEPSQERILSDGEYHFDLIYDEGAFVGLALYWESESFIYIEHLCVLSEMRNKSFGQKALDDLKGRGKTLILEIDPPVDEISRRRKGFYERCGFAENSFSHIHPPYHEGAEGHDLVVMTYPKKISREMFGDFSRYLKNKVMKNAFV